ncbi:probable RNA-binding protein 18 isoform X2 [Callorhinus ursinus]|nr:probable RNA-binding protein 18 isoform X2 [Zalophus californianus]
MTSRGRRGGAGVARHRRPGRRRCRIGRVWRAVGPRSRDLLLGHEPRGRRRGHERLMEAETKTLPLENASILSEGSLQEGHRLWIGNLDPKITEYHLLKLLQKFGTVKQFDFLFHKSGALEGQPRGYCFVNFETKQRYDHNKNDKILPISLEPSSSTEPTQSNLSVTAKIKAIEAKLKMMAENPDAEYPAAPVYSYFKPPDKKRTTPYSRTAWKSRR